MLKTVVCTSLLATIAGASLGASAATATHVRRAASVSLAPTSTKAYTAVEYTNDGPVDPAQPMHVVVGLALRNRWMVDVVLRLQATPGSPLYGRALTSSETLRWFSPTGAQVAAVAQYLAANGFTNIHATADNVLVTADGTAANVAQAFYTQLNWIDVAGRHIYANVLPALVPSSLGGVVVSVEGLNNMPMNSMWRKARAKVSRHTVRTIASSSGGCSNITLLGLCVQNGFGPAAFTTAYDAASVASGANTPIAVIAEGDVGGPMRDLRTFEALYNLPQVAYRVLPTGAASADTSGTPEWDMDTQFSTGLAQSVSALLVYDAPSLTDADTTVAFSRFESDDVAHAASASFGICEIFPAMDGTLAVDDEIFALAALHGQTLFAAAGDNGTTCPLVSSTGVPGTGLPAQSYPASSPYVVGVGGTTLLANRDNSYGAEVAWSGTGGGISTEENAPFWQQGIVPNVPAPPLPGVAAFKGVPDIAMDADPNTGANVVVAGQPSQLGGTSLAAPLALGLWARLETQHAGHLGFAAPLLYKEFADLRTPANAVYVPSPLGLPGSLTQPIGGFHDVVVGTNGLPAFPEYDYATGLGTLDAALQNIDITK